MDAYIRVLLIEQEPETISVLSLVLSEIKECRLDVCSSADEALLKFDETRFDLLLCAHGLQGKTTLDFLGEVRRRFPSVYSIISLPSSDPGAVNAFMVAGANDCTLKDRNYVPNLVSAVKKALIRISERDSFDLPTMSRADQFVLDANLPDVIFSLDLEGNILHVNRAVNNLLGFEAKELVARPFAQLIVPEQQKQKFDTYLNSLPYEMNFRQILALRNSLGIDEEFEVNCTLMDGEVIYGVARKEQPIGGFQNAEPQPFSQSLEIHPEEELDDASDADEDQSALPANLGPYRLITLLGAGAMGRVYKGYDQHLERYVAIKVINKSLAEDEEYMERFRREAKILAKIAHPNIALIYYFDVLEGIPFFCMEYLPGGSLEDKLQTEKKIDPEFAVSYTMQVGLALKEAWEKGVIHLDIKPSNLMLSENDRLKVVDFGLAAHRRDLDKPSENIVGTPLYLAPEQLQEGLIDHKCDIYSLGITFFQMVYGFVPFAAPSVQQIFIRKLNEDIPSFELLDNRAPRKLHELICRMTIRDPSRRMSGYAELIEDLENMRRTLVAPPVPEPVITVSEAAAPQRHSIFRLRGALYDQPFAEVLGEVWVRNLSGKLTISWIDLCKNMHFKDGKITAVLSNQEGERFLDLLVAEHQIDGKSAWKIQTAASDLFLNYSSAMKQLMPESRVKLFSHVERLAWDIMERMFSWYTGEFLFEEGDFPAQMHLNLEISDVLVKAVKQWIDPAIIKRRLFDGDCRIECNTDFQKLLRKINVDPSDRFLLYRFDHSIIFSELLKLSGIAEEEFFRLIYLYKCLGLISISTIRIKGEKKPAQRTPVSPHTEHAQTPLKQAQPAASPAPPELIPATPGIPSLAGPPRQETAHYYFLCATRSYREKNYWACVEYCKKALELTPEGRSYHLMGKALATHPRFAHEAMDALKKALDLDIANPEIELDMAEVYFTTGNYALARTKYQSVLQQLPDNERAKSRLNEIAKIKKH